MGGGQNGATRFNEHIAKGGALHRAPATPRAGTNSLLINVQCRNSLQKDAVLKQIGFEPDWVTISTVTAPKRRPNRRTRAGKACETLNS